MKKLVLHLYFVCICTLFVFLSSCTAPRSVMDSGKVTPKNQTKIGGSYCANIPTQTIKNVVEVAKTVDNTTVYDDAYNRTARYLLAYALDPASFGVNYYARYGVINKVDVGYQYAAGTHAFDAKYQFLGTTGSIGSESNGSIYGSVGLQYSFRNYKLPFGLDKVQEQLGFDLKRKDIFIPVIFSIPFGPEERIGHFSWGAAYNHTFLKYGFDPKMYTMLIPMCLFHPPTIKRILEQSDYLLM